jgi:hypothetical protein
MSGGALPCPVAGELVDDEIGNLATQYREAEKFIALIRAHLKPTDAAGVSVCSIPDFFDIDTAVGDQLTILGKWLGWPRRHCVCVTLPVLGFPYPEGTAPPLAPPIQSFFCGSATWIECGATGQGEVELSDDALYRRFLKARRYQMLGLYDIASLRAAAAEMWGATVAIHSAPGQAIIAFGRALTATETAILPLSLRVMPIAPGIRPMVHFGTMPIIGFGTGWASICTGSFLCAVFVDPYGC